VSEIFNETASTGDAGIRQQKQPVWPQKSSTKLLPRVTHRFDSGNSPCRLRNHHSKLCRCLLRKSSTKLLPRVTHGLDSANNPCGLRNHQRNSFHGWHMDSTAQKNPMTSEIITENRVSAYSEIVNETASLGDAGNRQRKQHLWPEKSSTKLLPRVMHGFNSSNSCGLRIHQRNCFHRWRMDSTAQTAAVASKNHRRKCFQWWRMDSIAQKAPVASEIITEKRYQYRVPAHLKILRKLHAFLRNGLNIRWPAHPKILRKLHAFLRNGLNIGWPAHLKILRKLYVVLRNGFNIKEPAPLKILRKLHAYLRNGLNIRWPANLKILRKLHAFLRNGFNIRWHAPLKIIRKLHAFLRNGLNIGW